MSFLGGGSGGSAPQTPPFHPIDISKIANAALNKDINRYESYRFPVFPQLSALRQNEINDAYQQLTSPLGPEFQNEFMRNATIGTEAATGGGNPYSGMALADGSIAKGSQSASFTRQAMAKQDYDRQRFEGLISANPVPGLGLSQQDIASMYIYNTGGQNAFAMGNYANQIAGANANYAAEQNNINSIGNLISGLGNMYTNWSLSTGNSIFGGAPDWSNSGFDFTSLGL